jgi:PhzF family phenazine biosynthesis protein
VLDFPAKPADQNLPPEGMLEALGIASAVHVARSQYDYLVVLENVDEVRALSPNFSLLARVQARGVIVTAPDETGKYDFVSRFFAPAVGVNEDPVTGSAHCCLAVYWSQRLGKTSLRAYQASARGGELLLQHRGDRVDLAGRAVTVMRGDLLVDL